MLDIKLGLPNNEVFCMGFHFGGYCEKTDPVKRALFIHDGFCWPKRSGGIHYGQSGESDHKGADGGGGCDIKTFKYRDVL